MPVLPETLIYIYLHIQRVKIILIDMRIKGEEVSIKQAFFLSLYYGIARHLPRPLFGRKLRYFCCKNIFRHCGKNVNIERGAYFSTGNEISIGNNSGLGINCWVPSNLTIGNDVMMGPNVTILDRNHKFDSIDTPMIRQGNTERRQTII